MRDYSLNAAKAVKRKQKMAFTNVAIKSGGQCIVAQLNHVEFKTVSSSLLDFYARDNIVKPVYDKKGALVEMKLGIQLQMDMLVHLTMYNTNNKVMAQGSQRVLESWRSTHLLRIMESMGTVQDEGAALMMNNLSEKRVR